MKLWGHDRVLADVVRTIRQTRPLVITAVFAGNVSDGHGQHQVSGVMAQEAFNAAADPKMFPDQIKAGLLPWAPLKVYGRVPFARVTAQGIFDYATGEWKCRALPQLHQQHLDRRRPARHRRDPREHLQPPLRPLLLHPRPRGPLRAEVAERRHRHPCRPPRPSAYHLYASRVSSTLPTHEDSYFDGIDTSLAAIASYAPAAQQATWKARLNELNKTVESATSAFDPLHPDTIAPKLAEGLTQTNKLLADIAASTLPAEAKYNMTHELELKQKQFNDALGQSLGLSVLATVVPSGRGGGGGPFGDNLGAPTSQTVIPGQKFSVNLHLANQNGQPVTIASAKLISHAGDGWTFTDAPSKPEPDAKPDTKSTGTIAPGDATDRTIAVTVPAEPDITRPYFSRPNLEQPYYDISNPNLEGLPTTPYPLTAEVAYTFRGVTATLDGTVQTVHRYVGPGPVLEPLLVAPAISVTVSPYAGIVPLTNTSLRLQVTVRSSVKGKASGSVKLELPPDGNPSLPPLPSRPPAMATKSSSPSLSLPPPSSRSPTPSPPSLTTPASSSSRALR